MITTDDTALVLIDVQVVADAVASWTPENRLIGLEKSKAVGAGLSSTETALFELLKEAGGDHFKEIIHLVKYSMRTGLSD